MSLALGITLIAATGAVIGAYAMFAALTVDKFEKNSIGNMHKGG